MTIKIGRPRKYDLELAERLGKEFGLRPQTVIAAWRAGRELVMTKSTGASKTRSADIDLHLAVMAHASDGSPLSHDLIGEVCGCNGESIRTIERKALKKLRKVSSLRSELLL
jgi:hypothetical protein|tara:strand:+ start:83 stop:418 length:336 start_codon:yes stop_codon:yes gene_type:complete